MGVVKGFRRFLWYNSEGCFEGFFLAEGSLGVFWLI